MQNQLQMIDEKIWEEDSCFGNVASPANLLAFEENVLARPFVETLQLLTSAQFQCMYWHLAETWTDEEHTEVSVMRPKSSQV